MYNIVKFGIDLKKLLLKTEDIDQISDFAINTIIKVTDIDADVRNIAGTLALMKGNEQFKFNVEELHEIANQLISGNKSISQMERGNFRISLTNKNSKEILENFKSKIDNGIYTIINFGLELKQLLLETNNPSEIGAWAFNKNFHLSCNDKGDDVHEIAMTLAMMEEGAEFEYTIEELHEIADRLIEGDISIVHIGIDPSVKLKCRNKGNGNPDLGNN